MESIDYEEQEQIVSENSKQQQKIKKFRQYLVSSGTIQHFVKFLFGLRTKQSHDQSVPSSDVLEMFHEYFGALTPDTSQQDILREQIEEIVAQNAQLQQQLQQVDKAILERQSQIARAKQQKRIKEQQELKNPKKGGKK